MLTEADLPRVERALSYPVLDPAFRPKRKRRWGYLRWEFAALLLLSPIGIAIYFWSVT